MGYAIRYRHRSYHPRPHAFDVFDETGRCIRTYGGTERATAQAEALSFAATRGDALSLFFEAQRHPRPDIATAALAAALSGKENE